MDEAGTGVELRVAGQFFLKLRHANQNDPNLSGIEDGTHLFEARHSKTVSLVERPARPIDRPFAYVHSQDCQLRHTLRLACFDDCNGVQYTVKKPGERLPLQQLLTTFKGGRVQMTPAVYQLHPHLRGRAFSVMSRYNKFADDSEHDYGVFLFAGYAFEWYIEYRTKDGTGVSSDPADPEKTFRVLTLYAASDMLR